MAVASAQTDTRERVGVVEGDEPADSPQPANEVAALTLKQRLAAIRAECFGIGKQNIEMGSFKIKGHTFEAVLAEVRPLFAKHGVDIWPNLVDRAYSGNRCDITVDFTFERLDESDERRVIRWAGAGTDNGDKAFAKAGTNCVKEMLKKVFLVTDRDDAKEEEEKVEHKTDEGIARGDVERVREEARATREKWAESFREAINTAKTGKDVKRLQSDHKEQLAALPEVTRTFFIDLIERRKKELPE